ncbi:MAG: exodeoxyribonuclease VII large subunit [Sphingomicrobium sp.]
MSMNVPDDPRSGLLASVAEGDNSPPLSVSELAGALKRSIEDAFGGVRVRGEISGFKRVGSGHCYFTLKDEGANIDAVIWRGSTSALAFAPEDGAEVIATGKLTTYPGRSKYQIVIDRMELAGEGALLALLEKRRTALAAEGLFDPARKRALPYIPRLIGVVTSPTGAVIRDILHRLADRFPSRVILWPVPVQGEGAADKVAAAIRGMAQLSPRPDLIIVARGGGSVEDLWAFNEEIVVRAAAGSSIPLISAVGHETDTTLIDHAADRRAPTPTAAAEMAVPVRAELCALLGALEHRASHCLARIAGRMKERFDVVTSRFPEPSAILVPLAQRADDLAMRLPRSLGARAASARGDLNLVTPRLRLDGLRERVGASRDKLEGLWRLACLAHPEKPLERGFVRVTDSNGQTLTQSAQARAAGAIHLRFRDGKVAATVDDGDRPAPAKAGSAKVERKPAKPYSAPQPGLFDTPDN